MSDRYNNIILDASKKYGVPYALIKAVITAESSFNPIAKRYEEKIDDTSYGLMQILTKTAAWIAGAPVQVASLVLPEVNITLGTRYLAYQMRRYGGSIKDAIAAYNAGSARRKANGQYINQSYVDKVYALYEKYLRESAFTVSPAPAPESGAGGTTNFLDGSKKN